MDLDLWIWNIAHNLYEPLLWYFFICIFRAWQSLVAIMTLCGKECVNIQQSIFLYIFCSFEESHS